MALGLGDIAPDFELKGSPDGAYRLSDFSGRPIILAFYPEDHSPVCSLQLRAYSDGMDEFNSLGAVVWGISPQSPESHLDFASRLNINFPLLSDTEKEVGKSYEVLGPLGFYRRSIFVIDRSGKISYCHRTTAGLTYKPTSALLDAVKAAETQEG
ncbi:MAG: peroxiredoxin [Actinomycetota bacterium]|nr:peroxiredoxin [Actinomycetota bacterium]